MRPTVVARTLGWLLTLACALPACGKGTEGAAESARLALLEDEVRKLGQTVVALQAPAQAPNQPASSDRTGFKLDCPQPWLLGAPLGATLWSCHAPEPTPEGMYPQCSVTVQPHAAIEPRSYLEHALSASPQLLEIKNLTNEPKAINGADAFHATFDADHKPIPLKAMSVLLPRTEIIYTVTCVAPSAAFASYSKAFRRIIDTFAFR